MPRFSPAWANYRRGLPLPTSSGVPSPAGHPTDVSVIISAPAQDVVCSLLDELCAAERVVGPAEVLACLAGDLQLPAVKYDGVEEVLAAFVEALRKKDNFLFVQLE